MPGPSLRGEKVFHGLLLYGFSETQETFSSISSSGTVCGKVVAGQEVTNLPSGAEESVQIATGSTKFQCCSSQRTLK